MAYVDWLLREGLTVDPLKISERNVINNDRLQADIECIEIDAELRIYLTKASALRDIIVEPRDSRTDQWMGSQTTILGHATMDFLDGERTDVTAQKALLFRAAQRGAAYSLKKGTRFHSVGYGLALDRIERLFDGEVPAPLRPLMVRQLDISRLVPIQGDQRMRSIAGHLFARGLNGSLRILMMEGAVIQLLAVHAAAAAGERPRLHQKGFTRREIDALHEARERLLADMRKPPSLGELAASVSLGEKKLNAGFKVLFGASVYETLRNERLEHARIVLEEGAEISLKYIAHRVGYNHTNNFINAFTARYGKPPRHYAARIIEDALPPTADPIGDLGLRGPDRP